MQAMSYMGQAVGQQRAGVQYVVGTPPQTPVLRPLRQPLYDSERLTSTQSAAIELFIDRARFSNGDAKAVNDTNMTASGQLGYPLEFDLIGFVVEMARNTTRAEHNNIYNETQYQWYFGQSVPWLRCKLTKLPEGIGPVGQTTDNAASVIANGLGAVTNFYNFTTPDRKARRISSTEAFKNRWEFGAALSLSATREATVFMLGILYAQL